METSLCSGQWEKLLLVYFAFPSLALNTTNYEVLELEGRGHDDVDDDASMQEKSLSSGHLIPCIMTTSVKKIWWVIAVGDYLLRGPEDPICQPDPPFREVC